MKRATASVAAIASRQRAGRRHVAIACLLASSLGSCRAFDAPRCSAPETIATVKSLMGETGNSPAALPLKAANATFSLNAIRTVSTDSGATVCQGRLTVESHMLRDGKMVVGVPLGPMAGQAPVQETPEGRAFRAEMERRLGTKEYEINYKVETTDDGKAYVTIVPSDADIRSQQDQQQEYRVREQQLEQNQRNDLERQREYQRQQDDALTREWEQRQQQMEHQTPRQ